MFFGMVLLDYAAVRGVGRFCRAFRVELSEGAAVVMEHSRSGNLTTCMIALLRVSIYIGLLNFCVVHSVLPRPCVRSIRILTFVVVSSRRFSRP